MNNLKFAFIHDWFTVNGGAEKVAKSILETIGDADTYCLFDFFNDSDRNVILNGKKTKTSFLQYFPFCKTHYRNYLPFFPRAIESFNLSRYDLIISSSFAVAKSVKTKPNQVHISYCHSPMRYAWDMQEAYIADVSNPIKKTIIRSILKRLQIWDKKTSKNVTHFIANSHFISERIKNSYQRDAVVIHPPVDTDFFTLGDLKVKGDYFLVCSRIVPYKKINLIVDAFKNLPNEKLIVIGDGPEKSKLSQLPNVEILGYLEKEEMRSYLRNAKAVILAAIEDFGISSLEAQACGTPVIALKKAGYLETIIKNKTGIFFNNQTSNDISEAVLKFKETEESFDKKSIRDNALLFSEECFKTKILSEIYNSLKGNEI